MTAPLSMDLRRRIADAIIAAEESHPLIAERFAVSITTVERISRKLREQTSLEPKKPPGRPRALRERHYERLRQELEENPFITSHELTRRFNKIFPRNRVHRSTILRAMHELGFSFKKNAARSAARQV